MHEVNHRQDSRRRRPAKKIVVSPTDPDAALGRDKFKVFRPLYNVQWLYDVNSPFVLTYDVVAQPRDAGMLKPMRAKVDAMARAFLEDLLVDAGNVTANHLAQCKARQIRRCEPWQENDFYAIENDKTETQTTPNPVAATT